MNSAAGYSPAEQMIVAGAREIRNSDVLVAGVGFPQLSVLLAQLSHAPKATVVFESGIVRTSPCGITRGIDTLQGQSMADMLTDVLTISCLAQQGFFTLGFLGGGQVDRHGNINGTAVGDYRNPTVRFPGPGGSTDIASFCKRTVIILNQKKQRFPERVDYLTSPGYLDGSPGEPRKDRASQGNRTRKGDHRSRDLFLLRRRNGIECIHAGIGVTPEDIRNNTGWEIRIADNVRETRSHSLRRGVISPEREDRPEEEVYQGRHGPVRLFFEGEGSASLLVEGATLAPVIARPEEEVYQRRHGPVRLFFEGEARRACSWRGDVSPR